MSDARCDTAAGSGPVYSASKAAVIHITKVWATQLAEFGIRVNCISPGAIVTPIFWGGYQTQSAEVREAPDILARLSALRVSHGDGPAS